MIKSKWGAVDDIALSQGYDVLVLPEALHYSRDYLNFYMVTHCCVIVNDSGRCGSG